MAFDEGYIRNEIKEIVFYLVLGILMAIILPIAQGFAFGGFEESLIEGRPVEFGDILFDYMIYYIQIIGGLFLIAFSIGSLVTIRKGEHPATQENPSWFRIFTVSVIHNPEQGALYKIGEYLKKKSRQ